MDQQFLSPSLKAPDWTLAEDQQLRALRRQNYSYGQIGKILGRTRESVAGRVYRLNLPLPIPSETVVQLDAIPADDAPPDAASKPKPKRKISDLLRRALTPFNTRESSPAPSTYKPPPNRPALDSLFLPLVELSDSGCRFPVGEAGDLHLFCGTAPYTPDGAKHHSPYCRHHFDIAYRPFTKTPLQRMYR